MSNRKKARRTQQRRRANKPAPSAPPFELRSPDSQMEMIEQIQRTPVSPGYPQGMRPFAATSPPPRAAGSRRRTHGRRARRGSHNRHTHGRRARRGSHNRHTHGRRARRGSHNRHTHGRRARRGSRNRRRARR